MSKPNIPGMPGASLSKSELTGIARALADYKKDVLQLHKLPEASHILVERYELEKSFRIALTKDLYLFIDKSCAVCPMGYTKDDCKANQCPFKTLNEIVTDKIQQLDRVLPGGV